MRGTLTYMVRYEQAGQRRRRNSITRDEIIAAARAIAETNGIEAVTVRALAAAMGAAPMSLYNHVSTREEILDAVLDGVLGELEFDDNHRAAWTAELERFALALAAHLAQHPWAVLPLMARPDPGEQTTRVGEQALAIALRGGLDASHAVSAFAAILALVYGRAGFLAAAARADAQPAADIAERIRSASAEHFPATAAVAAELGGYGDLVHLQRAVRAVIDGLRRAA
jgi:AcrR family transcriptional regulator